MFIIQQLNKHNPTHAKKLGQKNASLDFFKPTQSFGTKMFHLRHHMRWSMFVFKPSIKPL